MQICSSSRVLLPHTASLGLDVHKTSLWQTTCSFCVQVCVCLAVYLPPLLFVNGQTWVRLRHCVVKRIALRGGFGVFSLWLNLRPDSSVWPVPPSRQFNHTNSTLFPFPPLSFTHSTPHVIILHSTCSYTMPVFWGL